jgi:septal ring factor EnvC (AmiA/AmiB activator)
LVLLKQLQVELEQQQQREKDTMTDQPSLRAHCQKLETQVQVLTAQLDAMQRERDALRELADTLETRALEWKTSSASWQKAAMDSVVNASAVSSWDYSLGRGVYCRRDPIDAIRAGRYYRDPIERYLLGRCGF